MKFSEFKYEQPDLKQAQQSVNACIEKIKNAKSHAEAREAFIEFDDINKHLQTLAIICNTRFTINTQDEYYKTQNDFWDENSPLMQEMTVSFEREVLKSPYLKQLEEEFKKPYFLMAENNLKTFSKEVMDDLVQENQLSSQYASLIASAQIEFEGKKYTLAQLTPMTQSVDRSTRKKASEAFWNWFREHEEEFDDIFDKMVKVRTTIAKKLGYASFTELAYVRMNRLDYNQVMVEGYRKQILHSVVPFVHRLALAQQKRLGLDRMYYYDWSLSFKDGNANPKGSAEEILEKGREMYHELSSETAEFIDMMLENELLDVLAKPGKSAGGYMEFIPEYKVPFIFSNFNGTFGDVDVLTHEAGHAFQGYQSRNIVPFSLVMPTYESCEIHSMSMEFLTWPYMDKFFDDKADRYRYNHLSSAVKFLPYGVLVDHFQHEVYNHPEMSKEERKALWKKLDEMYRPDMDYEENDFLARGVWWYCQGHIFQSPFYYIDYTLAQVCAFQFWKRQFIDHDPKTWKDYLKICQVGGTQSFLEIVETGGLVSPFKEGTLDTVIKAIDGYLSKIDDTKL